MDVVEKVAVAIQEAPKADDWVITNTGNMRKIEVSSSVNQAKAAIAAYRESEEVRGLVEALGSLVGQIEYDGLDNKEQYWLLLKNVVKPALTAFTNGESK